VMSTSMPSPPRLTALTASIADHPGRYSPSDPIRTVIGGMRKSLADRRRSRGPAVIA